MSASVLAEFVSGLDYDDVPAATVAQAQRCILDALGCGLFGSTLPWTKQLVRTMTSLSGSGGATVWGTAATLPADTAALVNGTAVHAFELDDLHKVGILHPGQVTVPPLLAIAETAGDVTGRELVTALIAGYEVAIRVGLAAGPGLLRRGWHPASVVGTFASAAAVGRLLNLDANRIEHALGIAATQSAGLMAAQYGAMAKRLHAGKAAQSGVYAAVLARDGFTGISDVFADRYGNFFGAFADEYEPDRLTAGLGRTWEITHVGFKWYPACASSHTSIDAVLELRRAHRIHAEEVERCVVDCSTATKEHVGWPYVPDSVTTAQMNLSYAVAVALLDGEVTVRHFDESVIADPRTTALAARVAVRADSEIDAGGPAARHKVRVRIERSNGSEVETEVAHAKGFEPFPLDDAELRSKFDLLAGAALDADAVAAVAEAVALLPQAEGVASLAGALATHSGARTPALPVDSG